MARAPDRDPNPRAESQFLLIAGSITPQIYVDVKALLASVDPAHVLVVVLDSQGGAPDWGYRIMLELRSRYAAVAAVVPNEAFSTATMMAVGADYLFMGPSAVLGPLDTQIPHPERSRSPYISSLDIIRSLESIAQHSARLAVQHTSNLMQEGFGPEHAARIAHDFASTLAAPLTSQIDPYQLNRAKGYLSLSVEYTARLLATRRRHGADALSAGEAKRVASEFANGYSSHEFAIHRDDIREIHGLAVQDAESLDHWQWLDSLACDLACTDAVERVELLTPPAPPTPGPGVGVRSRGTGKVAPQEVQR